MSANRLSPISARQRDHINQLTRLTTLIAGAILGATLLAPGAGVALQGTIDVKYTPPVVTVRVGSRTDLRVVLDALCKGVKVECAIILNIPRAFVRQMTASGQLPDVLSRVLDVAGVGVYSIAITSGPRQQTRLFVDAQRLRPASSAPAGRSAKFRGRDARPGPQTSSTEATPRSQASRGRFGMPATSSGLPAGTVYSPQEVERMETALWNAIAEAMRNPRSQAREVTLPVPNVNGQPITVQRSNTPSLVTPFPGLDGQAITFPTSSTPGSASPFPP